MGMLMKRQLAIVGGLLICCLAFAADIPQDQIGAERLDKMTCIENTKEECINNTCMTSESTNCQDNCLQLAKDKCQENQD